MGLACFIATVETTKHRIFQFMDAKIAPDNMLVVIAHDQPATLGVLSSRVHALWALAAGGTLEDRPRYNKTRCFETFYALISWDYAPEIAVRCQPSKSRRNLVHANCIVSRWNRTLSGVLGLVYVG